MLKLILAVLIATASQGAFASYEALKNIHASVNTGFIYATDQALYGKSDHWATPAEFLANGAGDCEDFAIYKSHLLKERGIEHALVYFKKGGVAHIAVIAQIDGQMYLSDINAPLVPISLGNIKAKKMIVAQTERFVERFSS
ncbi:transglutaminase-like cysteine peptidase [Thiomicrorhabdus aquaedulcis]|uniref:transglutaminase-like cysteine peptidase n=1 Tax=Thiomicrorhabdus aquaedulcis TaxID=2211106 RepID=UPI000FDA398F|nr:transglutaminase-like cysteine peptidase [Thiomicrorhabdus aquaedulcis]